MADISTVTMPDGSVKDIKDSISRSSVSELVDNGAKNLSRWNGGTSTRAQPTMASQIPFTSDGGEYVISYDTSLTTGFIAVGFKNSSGTATATVEIGNAYKVKTVTIPASTAYFNIYTVTYGDYSSFMICTKAAWDISHAYQPYREDLAELTVDSDEDRAALVELVDNGAKNIADMSKSTFTSTQKDGVTVTLSGDNIVSSGNSGTGTNNFFNVYYKSMSDVLIPSGTWVAALIGTGIENFRIEIYDSTKTDLIKGSFGEPVTFTLGEGVTGSYARITSKPSTDCTGSFKLLICSPAAWNISHAYQPYRPSEDEQNAQIALNETNILSIQQEQVVQNREIATLREITNCKLYGYRIDKQDTNPDTRVTYLYDAVGMTPAYMDFSGGSFNYGSWGDIWFIAKNRPVALKYDGTVDYELSHTDFTKKIDGETASDVSDSTYGGNFMSEIPLVYVKRWEDTRYNYVVFCETKPNDDYLAQAHTNANGTVNPYIYLPMFKGSIDANNKLRSLMGTIPNGNTTAANEVSYVENCGNGWQLWDKAKIDLIMDLIVLITKSTNCRGKIGNGDCQTYNASDTRKDSKNNGANGKMMSGYEVGDTTRSTNAQFYGAEGTDSTNYGKHHMIAFYIEDLWANRWDRCLGFNLVNNVYKVKMIPPYTLDSDSTYQTLSVTPPSSTEGWLKNVSSGVYGDVPTEVGASNTSGFANYFYKNASAVRLSLFGGHADNGRGVGRYWNLLNAPSNSYGLIGGSPCYNAL